MTEASAYRFLWSEEALERFFAAYEDQRRLAGIATTLKHVSPSQRVDAIMTITGLNSIHGWRRVGEESAEALFLRYLTPVLTETRESAHALKATVAQGPLPGSFEPELSADKGTERGEDKSSDPVDPNKEIWNVLRTLWSAVRHVLSHPLALGVIAILVVLTVAIDTVGRPPCVAPAGCGASPLQGPTFDRERTVVRPVSTSPDVPQTQDVAQRVRLRFLDITIAAEEQYGFSLSPYTLAEYYAGESDFIATPALFLSAMLERWPLPAFEPVPANRQGAYALAQFSLAASELELRAGLDPQGLAHSIDFSTTAMRVEDAGALERLYGRWRQFEQGEVARTVRGIIARHAQRNADALTDDTMLANDLGIAREQLGAIADEIEQQLGRKLDIGNPSALSVGDVIGLAAGKGLAPLMHGSMEPAVAPWPDWPRYLLFLPLLPAIGLAMSGQLRGLRAALVNPPENMRGEVTRFASKELARSAPVAVRALSHKGLEPTGGIDAERSIAATLRHGGYFSTVPKRRRHRAEYVFLISRRSSDDLGFERARRLVHMLTGGGLVAHVYDYDPDPRTLFRRHASGERTGPLDLRAVHELHSDARLVLITEGSELVDYFTGRALPFVSELLHGWPRRMLLTPAPMSEWGEREMNLSLALEAPVGRATAEGLDDLRVAFSERSRPSLWRGEAATGDNSLDSLLNRVGAWLAGARTALGVTRSPTPRASELRLSESMLVSDIPPSEEEQKRVVRMLRGWLGEDGFYWLSACAVYPQLRYVITLYLGFRLHGMNGALYDERRLTQLSLLPWFHRGRMPAWLRQALFFALDAQQQAIVRTAVDAMLAAAWKLSGEDGEVQEGAELRLWQPEAHGIEMAPDDVMAELMLRDRSDIAPVLPLPAMRALFGAQLRRMALMRAAGVGAVALWCIAAFLLWPSSANAPHAPGAWLPLIIMVAFTTFGLFAWAVARRLVWMGGLFSTWAPMAPAEQRVAPRTPPPRDTQSRNTPAPKAPLRDTPSWETPSWDTSDGVPAATSSSVPDEGGRHGIL